MIDVNKELRMELNNFKTLVQDEIKNLKNQNKLLVRKVENFTDKIKSFNDLKTEFRAFFSINGYSEVLNTNSLFKKVFWLVCLATLFITCANLVKINYNEFKEYSVLTQLKVKETKTMTFPAVTICLRENRYGDLSLIKTSSRDLNLSDVMYGCYFESKAAKCSSDDFEKIQIPNARYGDYYDCFKFNGGKNARGHETPIRSAVKFGKYSGLTVSMNISEYTIMLFYIGDNHVQPIFSELTHFVQSGKKFYLGIQKTVDTKLPEPYNSCQKDINSGTSELVKKVLDQNITYRKINCYDLCLQEYSFNHNISIEEAFDELKYEEHCSGSCPVDCVSTIFDHVHSGISLVDQNLSTVLQANFHFFANKYTELVQTVKTSETDMISNAGGVLGLFLELSFLSAYRFIIYLYDIFF